MKKVIAVGLGILLGLGVYPATAQQTAPPRPAGPNPEGPDEVQVPPSQRWCQTETFSTSSTSFVLVPNALVVTNNSGSTKGGFLRWSGVAAHVTPSGFINVSPARDGVVLPIIGQWFLAYDLDGDGAVSDSFGIQWRVNIPPGTHTVQPAMSSSDGNFRNIDGYCMTIEMNTN